MAVKRKKQVAPELDLVPIMNLVTILIPFLIMAAEFIQLAVIDSSAPPIGDPDPNQEPEEDPFSLTVTLQQDGIVVDGSEIVRGAITDSHPDFDFAFDSQGNRSPLFRCRDAQGTEVERCEMAEHYDWESLATILRQIKLDSTDGDDVEEDIILEIAPSIRYEIVVQAMDLLRDGNGLIELEQGWQERSEDSQSRSNAPLVLFPRIALSGNSSN